MILKNINLKNFRKFKNTNIEFPDGVTGIIGLNGVGKSTIFEAISWVLYGPVAARTPSDQIKRQNTESLDVCRVELDFVFEGDTYRIIREMKGRNHVANATVTINGKIAATGADTVSRYIRKKLGMDFKSFFTSIFARQKELNALSTMNASERRPLILRMLGIDSLDEIIRDIKSDIRTKEKIVEKLESELVDEKNKDKILIYKDKIKDYKEEIKEIQKVIKKSEKKIKENEDKIKKADKKYKENKKKYEDINKEKEKLQEKKSKYEQKEKLHFEIKKTNSKIDERKKTIKKEEEKLREYTKIDENIKDVEEKTDILNKKIEESIKSIEKKKTQLDRIQKDIKEIFSKKEKIEKIGPDARCPTCERVLSEQYDFLIKKLSDEKSKIEKEKNVLEKEIKEKTTERQKSEKNKDALLKRKKYLQKRIREKERILTTVENQEKELKSEEEQIKKIKKEYDKLKKIDFDEKEFIDAKKQVKEIYETLQKTLKNLNEQKENLSDLKIDLKDKKNEEKIIKQDIKNLNDKIDELKEFKKRIKDEKKTNTYLRILSDVMGDFRVSLISRIRPTLSMYASDFFERLTNGKYPQIELDENYNIMIYDQGELFNIERFSGGEEDLANLCIRLAISEVITERAGGMFNFIILDEIFGSQDEIRRQNILDALNGLSSKFRQIFLITHVDDLKNSMENVIFVTEDERGFSNIKIE